MLFYLRMINVGRMGYDGTYILPKGCADNVYKESIATNSLAVSASVSVPATPYAHTCQASHLLSKVLQHIREDDDPSSTYYQNAMQLCSILSTFRAAITEELRKATGERDRLAKCVALFTPLAICFSAELALYFNHSCADYDRPDGAGIPEQISMQNAALSSAKSVCTAIRDFSKLITEFLGSCEPSRVSIFVGDCLYQAARNISFFIKDEGKIEFREELEDILGALRMLGSRWCVASKSQLLITLSGCLPGLSFFQENYLTMLAIEET